MAAAGAVSSWLFSRDSQDRVDFPVRFELTAPEAHGTIGGVGSAFAFSPDGRLLAYRMVAPSGVVKLYLRRSDEALGRELDTFYPPYTFDAGYPCSLGVPTVMCGPSTSDFGGREVLGEDPDYGKTGTRMMGDPKFHEHRGIDASVADRWRSAGGALAAESWRLAEALGYAGPLTPLAPLSHPLPSTGRGGTLPDPCRRPPSPGRREGDGRGG